MSPKPPKQKVTKKFETFPALATGYKKIIKPPMKKGVYFPFSSGWFSIQLDILSTVKKIQCGWEGKTGLLQETICIVTKFVC